MPNQPTLDKLLDAINLFLAAHPELDEAQLGWQAIKERGLVGRLLGDGDVTTKKHDQIIAFMQTYQPKE